jgi:hypothetical protein
MPFILIFTIILCLLLLFIVLAFLFFKFSKKKDPIRLGVYFFIIHFIWVVLYAFWLDLLLRVDGLYFVLIWPLVIIDLPISLLNGVLVFLTENNIINCSFRNFFLMCVSVFALLGSLQYYFIGLFVGIKFRRNPKQP